MTPRVKVLKCAIFWHQPKEMEFAMKKVQQLEPAAFSDNYTRDFLRTIEDLPCCLLNNSTQKYDSEASV